jgi:hypothetical protein
VTAETAPPRARRLLDFLEREHTRASRGVLVKSLVGALLVLVVLGYLGWVYSFVRTFDADFATVVARERLLDMYGVQMTALTAHLDKNAASIVDAGKAVLLRTPAHLRLRLEAEVEKQLRPRIGQLEDELVKRFREALEQKKAALDQAGPGSYEERFDALLDHALETYKGIVKDALDHMYKDYKLELDRVHDYLRDLQSGKDLTEKQRLQKELIETWLAIQAMEQAKRGR